MHVDRNTVAKPQAPSITPETERVETEYSIEWARQNPDLFAESFNNFCEVYAGWAITSEPRVGFLKLIAEKAPLFVAPATRTPAQLLASIKSQAVRQVYELADDSRHFAPPHTHVTECAIRERILIERAIIRRLVTDMIANGYGVTVDYGEGDRPIKRGTSVDLVMDHIGACDEEYLHIVTPNQNSGKWTHIGMVQLVYGNDGWDVICDYSPSLEPWIAGANDLASALGDLL